MPATVPVLSAYRAGSTDGRPGWRFTFQPTPEHLEAVKATIPARHREWNEAGCWWWVSDAAEREALGVMPGLESYMKQGAFEL